MQGSRRITWLLIPFAVMALCGVPGLVDRVVHAQSHVAGGQLAPWGLWVTACSFFAGLSIGAFFVAALPHVFGLETLKPTSRLSLFVALVSLLTSAVLSFAHLGRATQVLEILRGPGAGSTALWLGTSTILYGAILVVMLGVDLRAGWDRKGAAAGDVARLRVLGLVGLLAAIAFRGSAFAAFEATPFWRRGLLPFSFILSALGSGGALALGASLLVVRGGEAYRDAVGTLGRLVGILLAVETLFLVCEWVVIVKGGFAREPVLRALTEGPSAWAFWIAQVAVASVLPLPVLLRRRPALWTTALACLAVLAGTFAFRVVIVSQPPPVELVTSLDPMMGAETASTIRLPALTEWNFLLFCLGAAGFVFTLGVRLLPLARTHAAMEFHVARHGVGRHC